MTKRTARQRPVNRLLIPLGQLADIDQIDAILREVINGTPQQVRRAIDRVREKWPGRTRHEIHKRLKWLRKCEMQSPNGNRQMQQKQGVRNRRRRPRPWKSHEDCILRYQAGERSVAFLAMKLRRTVAAVRQRLSRLALSGAVRQPKYLSPHRISTMLGVSDSIVRVWFEKGLLGLNGQVKRNNGRSKVLISRKAVFAFCAQHPEKVNAERCDPDLSDWLLERGIELKSWNGSRQHLTEQKECPRCGRTIVGNGYFRHVNRCGGALPLPFRAKSQNGR